MVAQLDSDYLRAGVGRTAVRLLSYACFEGRPLTTRGRWFNPVVFGISAIACRTGPAGRVERPVFVVGTGRSGTTLLGTILSLHGDVAYLNEPKALWHRVVPDEDVIGSYSQQVGRFVLTPEDATADVVERFHRLYGAYLAVTRRRRVVDKYPEAMFRMPFLDEVFPDARYLWLVRDGNNAVASVARWSRTHGRTTGEHVDDWWGRDDRKWIALIDEVCRADADFPVGAETLRSLTRSEDRAAIEWAVTALRGSAELSRRAGRMRQVRYEALADDPARVCEQLFDWLGLRYDQIAIDYAVRKVVAGRRHSKVTLSPAAEGVFQSAMRALDYA